MTCIVGVEASNGVFIGADSAGSDGHSISKTHESKVFINGPFIIGYTTSFRFGNLLEHAWQPPEKPKGMTDHAFLCTTVIDSIRKCLSDGGFATKKDERERGGECLVGYRGRLYVIQGDYSVLRRSPYGACGSGEEFALGAMHAAAGTLPEQRIKKALKAAADCCASVQGPFKVKYKMK